jgi:hypothetical protein
MIFGKYQVGQFFGEKGTENIVQREDKLDFNVVFYQRILA